MPSGIYERSAEHKRKISKSLQGKHLSPETKQKISVILQKYAEGDDRIVNGRIKTYIPGHPSASRGNSGWAYYYRIVAETFVKRPLFPKEVVHHEDENKLNDDTSNLKIWANHGDHVRYHNCLKSNNFSQARAQAVLLSPRIIL